MKMFIYAVLDTKVGVFGQPFFQAADGAAIRDFSDAVKDGSNPNNMWHKHPEDFALYKLGEFDNLTGGVVGVTMLECLITASAISALKAPELSVADLDSKDLLNGVKKELVN